jgi:hypothetical protein
MPSSSDVRSLQAIREKVLARTSAEQERDVGAGTQKNANSFRFLRLAEILEAPHPPDWVITGYLEGDSLAVLFGESGSMKSFVAVDMALCVATGRAWHGHPISTPGPVLYIAAEGGQGLAKRLKAWSVARQMEPQAPLFILPRPVQFLDPTNVGQVAEAIATLVQEYGTPRLLIIDTLARCFEGDENGSKDMNAFVAALDRLRFRFRCTILVLHHSGLNDKNRARGSSVLRAALDWEYRLTRNGDSCKLVCSKSKDHEPPQSLVFRSEVISTGWVDPATSSLITSVVLNAIKSGETPGKERQAPVLAGACRIAFRVLQELAAQQPGGRVNVEAWREQAYRTGISKKDTPDARKKAFQEARRKLLETHHIGVEDNHYWILSGDAGRNAGEFPPLPVASDGREREACLKTPPDSPGEPRLSEGGGG